MPFVSSVPRVCGDDPYETLEGAYKVDVLPAYAGMIPPVRVYECDHCGCSPRMRG